MKLKQCVNLRGNIILIHSHLLMNGSNRFFKNEIKHSDFRGNKNVCLQNLGLVLKQGPCYL